MRSLHKNALGILFGLTLCACGGDDSGGGSPAHSGTFFGCVADVHVDGLSYELPTSCYDKPYQQASRSDVNKKLSLYGACVCANTEQEAKNLCEQQCSAVVQEIIDEKAAALNAGAFSSADYVCYEPNQNTPPAGGEFEVAPTPIACTYGGDAQLPQIRPASTSAGGDYATNVENVAFSIRVYKMIQEIPDLCIPGLGCEEIPDIDYEATRTFTASASLRYSFVDDGRDGCPGGGCTMQFQDFSMTAPDQTATFNPPQSDSVSIANLSLRAPAPLRGTVQADGAFQVSGQLTASFNLDGSPRTVAHNANIHGVVDRVTGAITVDSLSISTGDEDDDTGEKTLTVGQMTGQAYQHPPVAKITAPSVIECLNPSGSPVSVSAAGTTDPEGDIHGHIWLLPGGSVRGEQATAMLPLGSTRVGLVSTDQRRGSDTAAADISVVDTTPPAIALPADGTYSVCNVGAEPIVLEAPTAVDGCTGVSELWGEVSDPVNGHQTFQPGDPVIVGLGNKTVTWFARDNAGNVGSIQQKFTVTPAFTAFDGFDVRDGARIEIRDGATKPGIVGNAGLGLTEIGADALLGEVVSKADVFLRSRARIQGNVTTFGVINEQDGVVVTGSRRIHTDPQLPTSVLAWAEKPALKGGARIVNSGATETLTPGSYGSLTIHPNARVKLSSGRYVFDSVILDTGAVWEVPVGSDVEIIVIGDLTHRGNFLIAGGELADVKVLTFGTQVIMGPSPSVNAWYGWTLIAPTAKVQISTDTYLAQIAAQRIEVAPRLHLACVAAD